MEAFKDGVMKGDATHRFIFEPNGLVMDIMLNGCDPIPYLQVSIEEFDIAADLSWDQIQSLISKMGLGSVWSYEATPFDK